MGLKLLEPGKSVPNDINVVIEIPAHSSPIKYEVDKLTGVVMVDRFFATSMRYPCDYGYVPKTLSLDGDPVDALVVCPYALTPGVVIRCRPVGMLRMTDESGIDAKILCVPIDKLTKLYTHIQKADDLGQDFLDSIAHFFSHYKDLEKGKWVKVEGWDGIEEAQAEIISSIQRFQNEVEV